MNYFIKNIHINKLFHLEDFDIPIAGEKYPHLIITGKNGSGKTVLFDAISDFVDKIKDRKTLDFLSFSDQLDHWMQRLGLAANQKEQMEIKNHIRNYSEWIKELFGRVNVQFNDIGIVLEKYGEHDFVFAFYPAGRKVKMSEPKNPTKPVFQYRSVKDTATSQFLNFMSDLKIQEALARNEKQFADADDINAWFVSFESLLKQIYQDDNLRLEFNYKDYSFWICTEGKRFKFTQLSDGFAAALDIVADLIMKMQDDNSLTRNYQKEGIVLIDEIETHLHLGLQKIIMPLLTQVFPNIQFIITTHSPFVLSSMPNAVAYDLEHREVLDDLTDYSYESLAEGYFGVRTQSSYAEMQLETLRNLLEKETWTDSDKVEIRQLKSDFEKIPETVSPLVVGGFRQMMIQHADKLKSL